jgi:hypothetical protein
MIGENDWQALRNLAGDIETQEGGSAWEQAYEERVERFASIATADGGHVVWVGLPIERNMGRWAFRRTQNEIYRSVADRLPNVTFFDSWQEFADADGRYTAYYRDDGVHFNADGYTILMERVARHVTDEFDLKPRLYES